MARNHVSDLDRAILRMLKSSTSKFCDKYEDYHLSQKVIVLLQQVVNEVFCQNQKVITKDLMILLSQWITNHLAFHYENILLYQCQTESALPAIWSSFINMFAKGQLEIELGNSGVSLLEEQTIGSMSATLGDNGPRRIFEIPYDELPNQSLTNLFIIEGFTRSFKNSVFADFHHEGKKKKRTSLSASAPDLNHRHCRYNDRLTFDGYFIVRHLLLLMVAGLKACTDSDAIKIYETIQLILLNLTPIRRYLVRTIPATTERNKDDLSSLVANDLGVVSMYDSSYFWLYRCYLELLQYNNEIRRDPKNLFKIIFHYCSCKVNGEAVCCQICHQKCQKWAQEETTFYTVLLTGGRYPNPLCPGDSSLGRWSDINFQCDSSNGEEETPMITTVQ